jgi:uncharacterized membrane protein YfcA
MLEDFLLFTAIGFAAQIVDGALGMAFGVISATSLLAAGLPPATTSATVHMAEVFTTAASGLSHLHHRNVDWRLVARLAPMGVIGGALGAYALANVDAGSVRPVVSLYLVVIGCYLIFKTFRPCWPRDVRDAVVPPIGLAGGFLDALGGGGWGPIVTSTLIGRGHVPRTAIGSTNLSEFVVTVTISATFILTLGWAELTGPALGLIAGGVVAAPLAGFLVKRIPTAPLMFAVGVLVIATSLPRMLNLL